MVICCSSVMWPAALDLLVAVVDRASPKRSSSSSGYPVADAGTSPSAAATATGAGTALGSGSRSTRAGGDAGPRVRAVRRRLGFAGAIGEALAVPDGSGAGTGPSRRGRGRRGREPVARGPGCPTRARRSRTSRIGSRSRDGSRRWRTARARRDRGTRPGSRASGRPGSARRSSGRRRPRRPGRGGRDLADAGRAGRLPAGARLVGHGDRFSSIRRYERDTRAAAGRCRRRRDTRAEGPRDGSDARRGSAAESRRSGDIEWICHRPMRDVAKRTPLHRGGGAGRAVDRSDAARTGPSRGAIVSQSGRSRPRAPRGRRR